MSFVELHFHLLSGVDDGPRTIDESVELAAAALADGTRTVVVTPHIRLGLVTEVGEVIEGARELAARLRRERIPLILIPGGELDHTMVERLRDRELELIAHGPPGRRWLLLEAPFDGLDDGFTAAANELRSRGFAALIAHPERVRPTASTSIALSHELSCGSVIQLTADSFTGLFGGAAQAEAFRLLRSGASAVIASDAHGPERMPALRGAVAALAAAGEPDPGRFAVANPRALLERGLPRGAGALAA